MLTPYAGRFTTRAQKELSINFNRKLEREEIISRTDLEDIGINVHHMNIVSYAEAFLLLVQGLQMLDSDASAAISNLTMAIDKFDEVLDSNTNSKLAMRYAVHELAGEYFYHMLISAQTLRQCSDVAG